MSDIFIFFTPFRRIQRNRSVCIDSDTKTYGSFACTQIASLYGGVQNRNEMAGRQKSSHGCGYFVERIRSKNVPDREVGRAGGGK